MALKMEKLNQAVEMLNYKLKMPLEMYTDNKKEGKDRKYQINLGHFYVEQSNGGYRLERVTDHAGCSSDISHRGSKQEIYDFIKGMLLGLELAK